MGLSAPEEMHVTATHVRRLKPLFLFAAAFGIAAMAACDGGDKRTESVKPGMDRTAAMKALAESIPGVEAGSISADTLKNIWRRTQYLMAGRQIEILFYSPNNEHWKASDTVPVGKVIPVVLMEGKVVGVGRTVYDSIAGLYGLPRNKY